MSASFVNHSRTFSMLSFAKLLFPFVIVALSGCRPGASPPSVVQNPSPMVDYTRAHERIAERVYAGSEFLVRGILPGDVDVFIPAHGTASDTFDVLIHFHGATYVIHHAAASYEKPVIAATVHLGTGSRVYNEPFERPSAFAELLDSITYSAERRLGKPLVRGSLILSAFSAGYGAVRRIISTPEYYARVDALLLLDGIHASYVPERRVLAEGGSIDTAGLLPFLTFARDAAAPASGKRFLITHSEVFPGTFVSTTEATDFLLQQIGVRRVPVLAWGPLGMQQLSVGRQGRFVVMGFAGNTAPDHVDHLHALSWFLKKLRSL